MQTLSVKSFSCIDAAELELGPLTVLIGPQASGKSVLSKLTYFFNDLLREQFRSVSLGRTIDEFKEAVKDRFHASFPSSAWGQGKFILRYTAGEYQIRLTRAVLRGSPTDNVRVRFSPFFNEQYERTLAAYRSAERTRDEDWEWYDPIWIHAIKELRSRLGAAFVDGQLFIPAGRSFFTNTGKAFLTLEQSNLLDPVITRFGRAFESWLRRPRIVSKLNKTSAGLLGGSLRVERAEEFLITADGRKVPFSAMSSGQQELLPLMLALHVGSRTPAQYRKLIYIEEPEAHLFPSAQSTLVEMFVRVLNESKWMTQLFLTTHSPYVLAKINNLVKAHAVATWRRGAKAKDVQAILPKDTWIPAKNVRAYAIENRMLRPILDEEGLIDAAYLDDVSGQISREFSSLLGIEVGE